MADKIREPWNDPEKNAVAVAPSRMNLQSVQAVMLIAPDGNPYKASSSGTPVSDISLCLPTEIKCVVGDTIQLFWQAMVSTPNYKNYHFVGKSSNSTTEAKSLPDYFEVTATAAGDRILTFYILGDDNKVLDTKTTRLIAREAVGSPTITQNVWVFGDSFVANPTSTNEFNRRLTGTGGTPAGNGFSNINFHSEGNNGKEWNWYVTNENSPIVYSGVVNFEQYRLDNALAIPTVMYIGLTWNGIGNKRTDAEWDLWDNDVYTFIDNLRTTFPSINIKFVSPSMPSTYGGESVINGAVGLEGYGDEAQLKENNLRQAFIYERISQEVGYGHVNHIQSALQVDSVNNVGFDLVDVNTRNSSLQSKVGNNDVHPTNNGGYLQIGDAEYRDFVVDYCQTLSLFALNFNSADQEHLSTPNKTYSGDFTFEFNVDSHVDNNEQMMIGDNKSRIGLFAGGRVIYRNDSDGAYISGFGIMPNTGSFVFKVEKIGGTVNFYNGAVLVDTTTGQSGDFVMNRVGRFSTNYFDGVMKSMILDGENFDINEGAGITTTGSLGTVLTLNSNVTPSDMWIPE